MHAIDLTDERRVNAVAEHRAHAFGAIARCLRSDDEQLRFLRPQPRLAVLRADREPRPVGSVRAAAMPQRTVEHDRRARGHRRAHALVLLALVGMLVPPAMAAD